MSNRPHDASTFKYKFLFLFKNKKDQKSESGKAKSLAGLESIYKTWQKKNTVHCHHLLSGTEETFTNSNIFLH